MILLVASSMAVGTVAVAICVRALRSRRIRIEPNSRDTTLTGSPAKFVIIFVFFVFVAAAFFALAFFQFGSLMERPARGGESRENRSDKSAPHRRCDRGNNVVLSVPTDGQAGHLLAPGRITVIVRAEL